MGRSGLEVILKGITIDRHGTVTVEPGWQNVLRDLALDLQDLIPHPVDVEHVLAALVMSVRDGRILAEVDLNEVRSSHQRILVEYVNLLFQQFPGTLDPPE